MSRKFPVVLLIALACGSVFSFQAIPILSITFQGNDGIDSVRLRSQMRMIRERAGYYPQILQGEISLLERFYRDEGYLHAKVGPPEVRFQEIAEGGKGAAIVLKVFEGPRYVAGEISVRNVTVFSPATLEQMCPLRPGQPYSRRRLETWREKVADGYQTMGYIRFDAEIVEKINEARKTVDITLQCGEGKPYQVEKISIPGLSPPEQSAFKKLLLLGEGGVYNPEMIGTSLYFINETGAYQRINLQDVEVKIDDGRHAVELTFRPIPLRKNRSIGPASDFARPAAGAFRLAPDGPQDAQTTIKTEVALVNVVFSAVDRSNRAVFGLKASDFMVFEDKQPQKMEFFSALDKGTPIPLTIALLIDTSGSVKNKLNYEKETAAEFLRTIVRKGKDLALVIQFDADVNLVQDFTDDPNRLINALDLLQAGNSTALYDAIYLASEEKLKTETGRRVIVAITDGEDTSSKLRKEAAIESAQKGDVLIYGIGVRGEFGTNFGVLKKFAEETGGLFFSPRASLAEIQSAFRSIGEDLQGQYSLAYSSTNPKRDGTFRSIEIRSKISGIRVRARKGYYAPKAPRSPAD